MPFPPEPSGPEASSGSLLGLGASVEGTGRLGRVISGSSEPLERVASVEGSVWTTGSFPLPCPQPLNSVASSGVGSTTIQQPQTQISTQAWACRLVTVTVLLAAAEQT